MVDNPAGHETRTRALERLLEELARRLAAAEDRALRIEQRLRELGTG